MTEEAQTVVAEELLPRNSEVFHKKFGKGIIKTFNGLSTENENSLTGITENFKGPDGKNIEFLISFLPKNSKATHPYVVVYEDRIVALTTREEIELYDPAKHG